MPSGPISTPGRGGAVRLSSTKPSKEGRDRVKSDRQPNWDRRGRGARPPLVQRHFSSGGCRPGGATPPAGRLALDGDWGGSGGGADDLAVPATRRNPGESAGGCPICAADRLRRDRAGGRGLPRRAIRGLSRRSRRANGRLGNPGWHRAVSQPDAGRRTGARQPVGSHAWFLTRRHPRHVLDTEARPVRIKPTSASGRCPSSADSHDPISMARPNSTGPAMALVWSTTHPGPVIRCTCAIPAIRLKRGKSSQPRRAFTVTSSSGPRIRRSSTSSRVRCPTGWTSGGSGRPEERPNGSRITTRS